MLSRLRLIYASTSLFLVSANNLKTIKRSLLRYLNLLNIYLELVGLLSRLSALNISIDLSYSRRIALNL
jgi:hypothetical protein